MALMTIVRTSRQWSNYEEPAQSPDLWKLFLTKVWKCQSHMFLSDKCNKKNVNYNAHGNNQNINITSKQTCDDVSV